MLRLFKKKDTNQRNRGNDYYHRENLIQTIDVLNKKINVLDSPITKLCEHNLVFHNKELNSIIEGNLIKDFGKHAFILYPEDQITGHKIYFYRTNTEKFRFLIQLHFIENKFFFAATKVYNENPLSTGEKSFITNSIIKKYCSDISGDNTALNIKDTMGNVLTTHDDFYFYIKYMANNDTTRELKRKYSGISPESTGDINSTLESLI